MNPIERSPAVEGHVHAWCGGICPCGLMQCQFVKYLTPSRHADRLRRAPARCTRAATRELYEHEVCDKHAKAMRRIESEKRVGLAGVSA